MERKDYPGQRKVIGKTNNLLVFSDNAIAIYFKLRVGLILRINLKKEYFGPTLYHCQGQQI